MQPSPAWVSLNCCQRERPDRMAGPYSNDNFPLWRNGRLPLCIYIGVCLPHLLLGSPPLLPRVPFPFPACLLFPYLSLSRLLLWLCKIDNWEQTRVVFSTKMSFVLFIALCVCVLFIICSLSSCSKYVETALLVLFAELLKAQILFD